MPCLKKSIFSITCDRLNQYMKQKKTFSEFGGLNLNTSAQDFDSTLDLFPGIEENNTHHTAKPGMKQLTIFYDGEVVNVDNIKAEKAEELIAFATAMTAMTKVRLNVAMPMARRKSLQRFLQKRKDRISSSAPYSSKQAAYDEKAWLQLSL